MIHTDMDCSKEIGVFLCITGLEVREKYAIGKQQIRIYAIMM